MISLPYTSTVTINPSKTYFSQRSRNVLGWGLIGLALIGLQLCLSSISGEFNSGRELLSQPILAFVVIQFLAGGLYLVAIYKLEVSTSSSLLVIWILGVGLVFRTMAMSSTPILEDDYYRYLWDGAVTARGLNPYSFSPEQVLEGDPLKGVLPARFAKVATDSGGLLEKVNHPQLRSVYPPVAQLFFAIAHWMQPWTLFGWRLLLLAVDILTVSMLGYLLRGLGLPVLGIVVYWWNPLLIKEVFNSGHMDVIVLPFVVGAAFLAIRGNSVWAVACLALATATKLWPIVLLPVILSSTSNTSRKFIVALLVFLLLGGLLYLPVCLAGLDTSSGFWAYGTRWEMNDALFMSVLWIVQTVVKMTGVATAAGEFVTRILFGGILVLFVGWLFRRRSADVMELCRRLLLVVAALFLMSPAQFPWYYIWLLPFLTLFPRRSLLLLTPLLSLYYLRFYFSARDQVELFDYRVVWLEFVPVWILMVHEWRVHRKLRQPAAIVQMAA
ncbi:MAG: glycosyltransferase family 87 protein [Terriglobia bacterium]